MAEKKRVKVFPVNDSSLKQLKKIRFRDIQKIVTPTLKEKRFTVLEIDLQWSVLDKELLSETKLKSSNNHKMIEVYVFHLQNFYSENFYGIYQPFSGEFYVILGDEVDYFRDFHNDNVWFPLGYCKNKIKDDLFEVCRCSRCYKVKQHWFTSNKTLVACEDRTTIKTMNSTEDVNACEDFHHGDGLAMEIRHYKPMYITN